MMNCCRNILLRLVGTVALAVLAGCATGKGPGDGAVHLLNGADLNGFYTFLEGTNGDTDGVFTMTNGWLRISGQHTGYLATKREYSEYRLVAEFKWGNETWAPRQFQARESGILVRKAGGDRIRPTAIECELVEGGTGSVVLLGGAHLKVFGTGKAQRFDRPGRNPWKDELGFRGPQEIENARGEWNTVEIICSRGAVSVTVNGHKTLEGTEAKPAKGKIALRSDGAEIFFRRLDLYPVR
jgi:Domain of Unknown Function (DUF1080)